MEILIKSNKKLKALVIPHQECLQQQHKSVHCADPRILQAHQL